MNKLKVLMLGPARSVKGGMTTVVDNYFEYGLDTQVTLKYIETVNDKNKFSKFVKMLKGYIQFLQNIKKYDIVHIHVASRMSTFRKGIYVRIAKKYNKKVILHIHGGEYKIFYNECNDKKKNYIKETLNLADKIIVLSEEWKDYFETLIKDKDKIIIIYNSIALPKDFEKDLDTQKFLFLGRLNEKKGIYDLIDVFEKLVKVFPNAHLFIGGEGEIDKVKNTILEKKLLDNVTYLGWLKGKQKEKYLKECSFYVLPSYNEGMPMSVLESMAYKNITIATNVGGIPQVITHNKNGMLITPGNKKELYNDLKTLLEDKNLRILLSNKARMIIKEKFNLEENQRKLINVYNTIGKGG